MSQKVLITGGAGFIGAHTARHSLEKGREVVVLDDLSRRGSAENLRWLREHGPVTHIAADVADAEAVAEAVRAHADADTIIHLAGQVAVTASIADPRADFAANALGTLNLLEAVRLAEIRPLTIFASTNKVYGGMDEVAVIEDDRRYRYRDYPAGIPESMTLDFHSPYGCSKGAADQYVRDYARVYGLPTVVLRQSCIYGTRQFGIEDQGWVAWFVIAAVLGRPITIYGDGKQVRDVLYVDDLMAAYEATMARRDLVAGRIYNIGGGPDNTLSIWTEFGPMLEALLGHAVPVDHDAWRTGDQPVYVSDISRAQRDLDWSPQTAPAEGIERLHAWIEENQDLIRRVLSDGG